MALLNLMSHQTDNDKIYFYAKHLYEPKYQFLIKKSHTCEEGGTQLRISFWHLLMNLKNK